MTKQRPIYGHKHVLIIGYIWQKHKFQHLRLSHMDEHKQVHIRKEDNIKPNLHLKIIQIGMMEILHSLDEKAALSA